MKDPFPGKLANMLPKQESMVVFPLTTLLCASLTALVWFIPDMRNLTSFNQTAIAQGEIWRLFSCHFSHWSGDHLFWDVLAFLLLGTVCERKNRTRLVSIILIAGITIPLWIFCFQPALLNYRGLSGLDSACFGLLAGLYLKDSLSQRQHVLSISMCMIILCFAGKTVYELMTLQTLFVNHEKAAMIPVPEAHVIGFSIAIIIAILPSQKYRRVSESINEKHKTPCNPIDMVSRLS